ALAALATAQADLEQRGKVPADYEALFVVNALRALIETNLDRPIQASRALEAAATLRPNATLDPVMFPPDVRDAFAAIAAEVRTQPVARLTVRVAPDVAEVRLDGVRLSPSPVPIGVRPGRHYLHVEATGYLACNISVDLSESADRSVDVTLDSAA